MKRYRVISTRNKGRVEHLVIESRTKIGAILAYSDWKLVHLHDREDWDECDSRYDKSFSKIKFKAMMKFIVSHSFKSPGLYGEYLVKISEPISNNLTVIGPFK